MIQVVAAIIEREGRILVGQRTAEQSHPLKWEFPGGKLEAGESPGQALARELKEELDIDGAAGEELTRYEFTYPGKQQPIGLIFYRVRAFGGEPRNLIYREMRWAHPHELIEMDFVEGDRDFLYWFHGISDQDGRSRRE
ncbi:MAG TPA: (deoxy)nucleoside triphosphate pyrophosphohydrolase [Candidatus Limnocylindrales bacterium]|nr:(deoxy)nucleoside triphosphate pyrophosphohydrolase [Candidatus Limnocylindrales bacterium]